MNEQPELIGFLAMATGAVGFEGDLVILDHQLHPLADQFGDLVRHVARAAMTVLNELKPGLDEKLYERALVIELRERGRKVNQQKRFTACFKEHDIGTLIPDLIVDELVIVDTKVATTFNESHIAQMTGYLSHTGLRLGLLLNFKHANLDYSRTRGRIS